jgi:tetratricopeptide (TPR) repeat protein
MKRPTPRFDAAPSRTPAAVVRHRGALLPLTIALIVGCSAGSAAAQAPAPVTPPAPAASAVGENLPQVDLTGELLFKLMAAETALQRGDPGSAYTVYLDAARQTRDPRLARRATEIALGARASNEAIGAARLWRELAPASTEALQTHAVLLIAAGRNDEAATVFEQQIKASATPLAELQQAQRILARAPDRQAALALLTRLTAPYRADPAIGADVMLVTAAGAHAAGQSDRAIAESRAALKARPDFERAALITAQLLASGRNSAGRAEALDLLAGFVREYPKASEARLAYARLLLSNNQGDQARQQFAAVLAQDPDNLDALFAAGVLSLDHPATRAEARRHLERYAALAEATEGKPDARDPDAAYLNLARLAEEERKYDEALRWLDRIDSPDQVLMARMRKALVLGKLKRVEDGRRLLAEASPANDAEREQLLQTEAQLLREAGRNKEALALLQEALMNTPDSSALLYDAALIAEKLKQYDLMEGYLRRTIQLKPDEPHAYNALGYSLAERNVRLKEAETLIAQALKLAPEDAYILDSMGWVQFRLGNLARARAYLERAWALRPHAEVGAHLGETLWLLGERDTARRIWRESQAVEPDNEALVSTLRRLKVRL